jgi:Salmonella virulence plasmid 65kDa B protein
MKHTKLTKTRMTTIKQRLFSFSSTFVLMCFSLCLSLNSATQAQTLLAGSVAGQFSVNQNGAATYTLPIQVPPGVTGMQPQLSLNYNSQDGHGLAGVGWSLGGLSVITRCEMTLAQDGADGKVRLDGNDKFCLEGQRLMLVAGAYGQNGAEYRTEIDRFSKIISYGASGNGPSWFKVWTKSGQIMEFGNTVDSRVIGTGYTTARQWSLNSVADVNGNVMTISYYNSADRAEHLPERVMYGGNTTTATAANRRVDIVYEARTDITTSYMDAQLLREARRISKISTLIDAISVKNYSFTYETSASTSRSRLTQIKECDGLGTSCLKPVVFSYNEMDKSAVEWVSEGHSYGASSSEMKLVDLFGDGRPVYYTHGPSGQHYATRLKPDGTEQNWTWSGFGVYDAGWDIVDVFGDGKPIYWTHDTAGNHYGNRLNADNTVESFTWTGGHGVGTSGEKNMVDLFGDGKPVYYTRSDNMHYATRLNSNNTIQKWEWAGYWACHQQGLADLFGERRKVWWMRCGGNSEYHYASQFNSDGSVYNYDWYVPGGGGEIPGFIGTGHVTRMVDLFEPGRDVHWNRWGGGSNTHIVTQLNKDRTYQQWSYVGDPDGIIEFQFADLFGDGHKVYWTQSGSTHKGVRMNKDGTVEKWVWNGHGRGADDFRLVDLYGDGRQAYWTRNYTTHSITRFSPNRNPDGTGVSDNYQYVAGGYGGVSDFADLYGDGRKVYWTHWGPTHSVTSFSRGEFDNVKVVTGSTGLKQTITHNSISSVGGINVYYADSAADAAVYPKRDIRFPMRVVSKVDSDNGLGGVKSNIYKYGGLKSEANTGRGFLGFRWMESTDLSTNINQFNIFNQNFPFIGMLKVSETRTAGNTGLLKRTTINPGCKIPQTQSACAVSPATNAPGTLYFPYTFMSSEQAWDLNGVELPATVNIYQYDLVPGDTQLYGNPTQIVNLTRLGWPYKSVSTVNEYLPTNTTNWVLGRLKKSTVTNTIVDSSITTGNPIYPLPRITVTRLNGLPINYPGTTGSTWYSSDATSVTLACTSSGTGYTLPLTNMALNGSTTTPTSAGWIGNPSTCTWTVTGQGGTATYVETLTTVATPPTISVSRLNGLPMKAPGTTGSNWSTTNATSVTLGCTSTGTGFAMPVTNMALSGNTVGATSAAWVNYPSTCTWTATGPGGTVTYVETLTTVYVPRIPVYWVQYGLAYFYTTSVAERDWHINNWGATYLGVPFYVYDTSNAIPGLVPVHRYIDTTASAYFYTTNTAEVTNPNYSYQGIAWYAQQNAANSAVPLYGYRFYYDSRYFALSANASGFGDYNIPQGVNQYVWTAP